MKLRTVTDLQPPHGVRSSRKVASLEEAYRRGDPILPVAVLRRESGDWAVTGSHRIAALRRLDARQPVVDGPKFVVIDGMEIERLAMECGDGELYRLLGMLLTGELEEELEGYHRLVDALCDYVEGEARRALRGQGLKA